MSAAASEDGPPPGIPGWALVLALLLLIAAGVACFLLVEWTKPA